MSKTPVEFKGELKWVVVPPFSQPQKPFDPKPGQENNSHYSVEVECSDAQYKSLIKQGVSRMTVLREDEKTGKTFIRIRAPKVNGTYTAADPVVKKADGSAVEVMIANGSTGTVKADIESFTTKAGKTATALRFHTIEIDNLIPFERQVAENNEQSNSQSQDLNPPTSNEDW